MRNPYHIRNTVILEPSKRYFLQFGNQEKSHILGLFLSLVEGNLLQVAAKHVAKHVANSHQFCAGELWLPYVFCFLSNSLYSDGTYI